MHAPPCSPLTAVLNLKDLTLFCLPKGKKDVFVWSNKVIQNEKKRSDASLAGHFFFPVGGAQASFIAQASWISAGGKVPFIPWGSLFLLCDQVASVSELHSHWRMWRVMGF